MDFKIYTTADGYFIGTSNIKRDIHMAKLIKMNLNIYQRHLIRRFNGYIVDFTEDVYFETEIQAENALNWVESTYVMNCLTKEKWKCN